MCDLECNPLNSLVTSTERFPSRISPGNKIKLGRLLTSSGRSEQAPFAQTHNNCEDCFLNSEIQELKVVEKKKRFRLLSQCCRPLLNQ